MHAHEATAAQRPLATPLGLGMAIFLVSEAFLFGSLFIIYYYLRAYTLPAWPPANVHLALGLVTANTVILLSSSVTMHLASTAIRRGSVLGLAGWLVVTIALGSTFLLITAWEWANATFRPWDHAYGSIFYTLTGFHGLHVLIGLGLLTALLVRTLRGHFSATRHLAVEIGGLYWHFVDVVWIAVYTTIFLVR